MTEQYQRFAGAGHDRAKVGKHITVWGAIVVLLAAAVSVRADADPVKVPMLTSAWMDDDSLVGAVTVMQGVPLRSARQDFLAFTTCSTWMGTVGCTASWASTIRVGAGSPGEDIARALISEIFGGRDPEVGETATVGFPTGGGSSDDGSAGVACWAELDTLGGNPTYSSLDEFKNRSWPGSGVGCVTVAPSPIGACSFDVPALSFDHGVVSVERPDEKSNTVSVTCAAPMSVRFVLAGGGSSVSGGPGISAEISLDKEALPVKKSLVVGKQSLTLSSTLTATREATAGQFSGAGVLKFEVD